MTELYGNVHHILLADDDDDDKVIFDEVIKSISPSTRVSYVSDGNEALEFLASTIPDIVFLDLNMPLKGGIESLRDIRENSTYKQLPVIMYSTSSNQQYIDECYDKGADCYIVKPYTIEKITKVLEMALGTDWSKKRLLPRDEFIVVMPG